MALAPTLTPTGYRTLPVTVVEFGDGDSLDRFETAGHLPARTVLAAANGCARDWGWLSLKREHRGARFPSYTVRAVTHAWATTTPCPGPECPDHAEPGHHHWPTIHAQHVSGSWPVTIAWIEGQPIGQAAPTSWEG